MMHTDQYTPNPSKKTKKRKAAVQQLLSNQTVLDDEYLKKASDDFNKFMAVKKMVNIVPEEPEAEEPVAQTPITTPLPKWADRSSPEYDPNKVLSELETLIATPVIVTTQVAAPITTKPKLTFWQWFVGLFTRTPTDNSLKIEELRIQERKDIAERKIREDQKVNCFNGKHIGEKWTFKMSIDLYDVTRHGGIQKPGQIPCGRKHVYIGSCRYCSEPMLKELRSA